jgi:hypothetical protein
MVCASALEGTIVRPPYLPSGPRTECSRVEDGRLPRRRCRIARAALAHSMLNEAESPRYLQQVVGVCN